MRQNLEIPVFELKLAKTNWLIIRTYTPPSLNDITFTSESTNIGTFYRLFCGNILLTGDFKMTSKNQKLNKLIKIMDFVI